MSERKIIHLDMDAFYAAIEERDNPDLRGKPVIVGSPPNTRGVVSTCNYIARKYGVHSAMSTTEAYKRCPNAIFVKPNFEKYKEASSVIHSIMSEYTDVIEFVALDEGYMDVSGSELLFGSAEKIALELKQRVFKSVGITCSVGVGYSMMSAKCASEEKKPNGFFVINSPEEFTMLMHSRPVGSLYGIGAKTAERLVAIGIKTIGQLANAPDIKLKHFGSIGPEIKNHARGTDDRKVTPYSDPKSIGKETTFLNDVSDIDVLTDTLLLLSGIIGYRLYSNKMWCRTVTLKIKFADMKSITRSYSGANFLRDGKQIYKSAEKLLRACTLDKPIRLIGLSASNLTRNAYEQISFADGEHASKSERLGNAILDIKSTYGVNSLKTAKEIAAEKNLTSYHKLPKEIF